jgi:hypothetical protein
MADPTAALVPRPGDGVRSLTRVPSGSAGPASGGRRLRLQADVLPDSQRSAPADYVGEAAAWLSIAPALRRVRAGAYAAAAGDGGRDHDDAHSAEASSALCAKTMAAVAKSSGVAEIASLRLWVDGGRLQVTAEPIRPAGMALSGQALPGPPDDAPVRQAEPPSPRGALPVAGTGQPRQEQPALSGDQFGEMVSCRSGLEGAVLPRHRPTEREPNDPRPDEVDVCRLAVPGAPPVSRGLRRVPGWWRRSPVATTALVRGSDVEW